MIDENQKIIEIISKYIDLSVTPCGEPVRSVVRVDKRDPMYGGNGIVYILQMFGEGELVNNRLGAYMVMLKKGDSSGFHTHGDRHEQELYITMHGVGEFMDKIGNDGNVRSQKIIKGSITTVQGDGYHAVENISDEPLILFVITTNEK